MDVAVFDRKLGLYDRCTCKSNSFANLCTKSTNQVPYRNNEVSIHLQEKFLNQVGIGHHNM